jgi:predicted RNA binding protein YcfA (HicA-like mRNA interferase family)
VTKLPVVKPRELLRALQRSGFYVHHHTGSHARLLHVSRSELRVTVPIHSKDIPKGTLRHILRQAQLTPEQFKDLLKA